MLFYRILDLEILETAKMTFKSFKIIRNDTFRQSTYNSFLLAFNPSVSCAVSEIITINSLCDLENYFRSNAVVVASFVSDIML